jgi:quinolinate synthase
MINLEVRPGTLNERLAAVPAESCETSYGPEPYAVLENVKEPPTERGELPVEYRRLSPEELTARIAAAKATLGTKLFILGHHYQRDEIIQFADARGDSFKLAQLAAARPEADYIVFCGVHFMAESADILSAPHQKVILPNLTAGCSMADMANIDDVTDCWEQIAEVTDATVVPVTYMNSAADLKAFCGERDGVVCTSSNAEAVLRWAWERGEKILFFPDEHLGRNTAHKMGVPQDRMIVWDPRKDLGGNTVEAIENAQIILWKGFCSVHGRFTPDQVRFARENYPGIKVIVHPECRKEVVDLADLVGSTEFIIKQVEQAPAGTQWAIGTEINLVNRLAQEHPDQTVFCLDPVVCPCSTMYRIHPAYLCWVLENLVEGRVLNQITVDPETTHWAKVALDRMLSIH